MFPILGHCEDESNVPQQEEFPSEGVLAVSGNIVSAGSLNLPLPLGLEPGKTAPITGGLSQREPTKWSYNVANNFDKKVFVNLEIQQYDSALKKISSTSHSHRLKPGETAEGEFNTQRKTVGCALVMKGWKFVR